MRRTRRRNDWIRWLAWFAGVSLALMGGVIAWIAAVDPYQMYHPTLGGHPRFNLYLQRFQIPGIARTSTYEIALVGTSFLQNIPNSAVRRICGKPAVNLCMSGASIHEETAAMRLAMQHKGIQTIIATIDYNSLSGGRLGRVVGSDLEFPEYLYDSSPFDKLPYLLSWNSIAAVRHVLWEPDNPGETQNADWPWKFPATMRFEASSAASGINPGNINAGTPDRPGLHLPNLALPDMQSAFGDNIFPLLRKYPNLRVHFVFAPYSILAWHDFAQRGQIPVYFAFKKWLVAQTRLFPNMDVIDFQDRADIITNLSLYADIYHSNESVDEQMVRAACEGSQVLTAENVGPRTESLLRLVKTTDPAKIVAEAKGKETPSISSPARL